MNLRKRARLIAIIAMAAAVILAWVAARASNQEFSTVLMVEGVFILVVGLILALVGTLQRWRKEP